MKNQKKALYTIAIITAKVSAPPFEFKSRGYLFNDNHFNLALAPSSIHGHVAVIGTVIKSVIQESI